MRRSRLAAFFATLALILAACAQLPTRGQPQAFEIDVPDREPIVQTGVGPQKGSTPDQLIQDFMRACAAGAFDNYDTAKLYLLPTVALTWQPTAQVSVFATDHMPTMETEEDQEDTAQVTVTIPTIASLDDVGFLNQFESETPTQMKFRLAKNPDGEWRIAALQDGVILSQSSFITGFNLFNLFFVSADGKQLVADPRWVPRTPITTHLVQALLQGPPEVLEGAVMGHLSEGLDLETGSVVVSDDGTASVQLRGDPPTDSESRKLLAWEFSETLKQSASVKQVEVSINGVPMDMDSLPTAPDYDRSGSLVWLEDGAVKLGLESDNRVVAPPVTAEAGGAAEPISVRSFPSAGPLVNSPVAWINDATGVSILSSATAPPVSVPIADPSKPSIDRWGNVWTSASGNQGDVVVVPAGGGPQAISTGLTEQEIRKVVVSPDGARIAFLTKSAGQELVWIGTVVADGVSVSVTKTSVEERVQGAPLDLSWANSTTLVVLTQDDERQLEVMRIGDFALRVQAPADAIWVSAGSGTSDWIVQREDQVSYQRIGPSWRQMDGVFEYISYAG